ncbi:MAG: beta-N-acetylhexosaminidase [Deltaproteobacteria bacterium]|nr:beta-N-acetylhexosaminidase [Deltaproteobacteria bacterium]
MTALLALCLALASEPAELPDPGSAAIAAPPHGAGISALMWQMTLEEKAAQILLAYPQLDREGPVDVGGVLMIGPLLKDLDRARALIASSRRRARIPPFFAADIEGGDFNRLKRHPDLALLPSAAALGALPDAEVEAWGSRIGRVMHEVGLNMNLAPVLDVASSGHMSDNHRSFGGEADLVVAKGLAFAKGLSGSGVIPVAKHFPGYGDLPGDTDHALVTAAWDRQRVEREMSVFQQVDGVMGGVMMANVSYAAYGGVPAVLDPELVQAAQGQGWLTVTDDLAIGVLGDTVGGTPEQVVRRAFLAGNDLLLTTAPPDWDQGVDYVGVISQMVREDPALEPRLDRSVRRVLQLKARMGLLEGDR